MKNTLDKLFGKKFKKKNNKKRQKEFKKLRKEIAEKITSANRIMKMRQEMYDDTKTLAGLCMNDDGEIGNPKYECIIRILSNLQNTVAEICDTYGVDEFIDDDDYDDD